MSFQLRGDSAWFAGRYDRRQFGVLGQQRRLVERRNHPASAGDPQGERIILVPRGVPTVGRVDGGDDTHRGGVGWCVVIGDGVVGDQFGHLGGVVVGGGQQPGAGGDPPVQAASRGEVAGDEAGDGGERRGGVGQCDRIV